MQRRKKIRCTFIIIASLIIGIVTGVTAGFLVDRDRSSARIAADSSRMAEQDEKLRRLAAERAWYRWYFGEYAATLRRQQYDTPTLDINDIFHRRQGEFLPLERVSAGQACPPEAHGAYRGDYIYFAARVMPLPHDKGVDLYAMSYLGTAEFAHSGKVFDAIVSASDLTSRTYIDEPLGLARRWLDGHSMHDLSFRTRNGYGYSAILSYNSGDIDGDGRGDFVFERWLVLSGRGYDKAAIAPRRSMFFDDSLIAVEGDELVKYRWAQNRLEPAARTALHTPAHSNVPYLVMPMAGSRVVVRTAEGADVYTVDANEITYFASISGLVPGELQTGAMGDFTGDGHDDVWFAQVATPTPYPGKQDQIVLIDPTALNPGDNRLSDVAWFTVRGSARYSDYDGIGTTVSPIAGDITGDGRPDLSFTGHRHMNEAGALYILPGDKIEKGRALDITDPDIIKILGRQMSQLAPPFHHWDANDVTGDGHDDIVIPADNDLCSGLNAGAIYLLSGRKIVEAWRDGRAGEPKKGAATQR